MKNKYGTTEKIEEYHENGQRSYFYQNTLDIQEFGFKAVIEHIYNEEGKIIISRSENYITNFWETTDEFGNKFSHSFTYPRNIKTENPIELPSEDEIIEVYDSHIDLDLDWIRGALWMRDLIQGGNK